MNLKPKTKQQCFKDEERAKPIFEALYKEKGWELIERIRGKKNKEYDCLIKINNEIKKVEEKALDRWWPHIIAETVQDTETNDPGWIYYCQADYMMYKTGSEIWMVDFLKFKEFFLKNMDKFSKKRNVEGWGKTEFYCIEKYIVRANGLGDRIK